MHVRRHRRLATLVLAAVTPLMVGAAVTGLGARAETAGLGARGALASINPQQCIRDWESCMAAEQQGNPCDLIVC